MCMEPPLPWQVPVARPYSSANMPLTSTPLGDAMTMPAVGAGDVVVRPQVHHDAGGGGFLSGVEVDEPGQVAGGELHVHPFLELPDRLHGPVGPQQLLPVQGKVVVTHRVSRNG